MRSTSCCLRARCDMSGTETASVPQALGVNVLLVALAIPWAAVALDKNLGTAKSKNATLREALFRSGILPFSMLLRQALYLPRRMVASLPMAVLCATVCSGNHTLRGTACAASYCASAACVVLSVQRGTACVQRAWYSVVCSVVCSVRGTEWNCACAAATTTSTGSPSRASSSSPPVTSGSRYSPILFPYATTFYPLPLRHYRLSSFPTPLCHTLFPYATPDVLA